jgi:CRISPR-associated endonuclease/helicase Cas3
LPLLADSILVVDEVHSFDRKLFSAFKLFLQNFDLSVLCLTASLIPERKRALAEDCGLEIFPQDPKAYQDLEVQAARPRYDVQLLEDEDSAQEVAFRAFQEGKRVLWVVNKVDRCQRLARTLSALCYHSRFKLEDRKRQHNTVIAAFKNAQEPVLAITTQVCEMSLDLDAQVLISEYAPITSLIQRLGRCNRRALQEGDPHGQVYYYPPEDDSPYDPDDLVGREDFIKNVAGREVSQLYLEQLLEAYGPAEPELERYAAFLENGPWAKAREESLREESNYTVQAILSDDLEKYLEFRKQRQPTDALLLPVPRRWAEPCRRLGRFPLVAPASHYHRDFGFFDYPLEAII